jgi:hypothetical protein
VSALPAKLFKLLSTVSVNEPQKRSKVAVQRDGGDDGKGKGYFDILKHGVIRERNAFFPLFPTLLDEGIVLKQSRDNPT